MKKVFALMLGMALLFGTVTPTFAQSTAKKTKKKGGKKKTQTPKKDGGTY